MGSRGNTARQLDINQLRRRLDESSEVLSNRLENAQRNAEAMKKKIQVDPKALDEPVSL